MSASRFFSFVVRSRQWREYSWRGFQIVPVLLLVVVSVLLASCSGINFGGNPTAPATTTPSNLNLAQLHWCSQPLILFRDLGAPLTVTATATAGTTPTPTATVGTTPTVGATNTPGANTPTPTTLNDWTQVQPLLGFSVYLPVTLPAKTCLVSASGTIHDPIFGSSFTIGYLLPDHSSISLAEAPLRSQNPGFQCSPSSTATPQATATQNSSPTTGTPAASSSPDLTPSPTLAPSQLCSGAHDTTNIFFSARGSTDELQKFFDNLQPNINWVPAS